MRVQVEIPDWRKLRASKEKVLHRIFGLKNELFRAYRVEESYVIYRTSLATRLLSLSFTFLPSHLSHVRTGAHRVDGRNRTIGNCLRAYGR